MMYFLIQIIFSVVDNQSRYADNGPISCFQVVSLSYSVLYSKVTKANVHDKGYSHKKTKNTAAEPFAMPFHKQLICITFSCI